MAHKIENLKLKNSNGDQLAYTTIIFMDSTEFAATTGVSQRTLNAPPFSQYKGLMNQLFLDMIGESDFIDYAKPILTGLTSNSNVLTQSNSWAYAFASALPQIFEPYGPYRQGQTSNEFIINGYRYAYFGSAGTNDGGAYTLTTSLYRYSNPLPDTTSKIVLQNTGTIAQIQQNSTLYAYFLKCEVSDLDDPWGTITDYSVFKLCLYYGGNQGSPYSAKWLNLDGTGGGVADAATKTNFINDLKGTSPDDHFKPGEGEDPYKPGGTSTTGGGTGNFDLSSDTIGVPALPTLSAVDTGFITLYGPTLTQVQQLAAYMWQTGFDWTSLKNVIANPIDAIMGFSILPFTPDLENTASVVKVGNITTSVSMPKVTNQFKEIDCGSINMNEFWGSYLDYSPYTKCELYLPGVGIVPLDIDDVMNKTLSVVYHVDVLSGACVVFILSDGSQIATYNGQLSANVPLTSNDFANTINGILGLAGNVGSLVASGGKSAASAIPGIAANAVNSFKPNIQRSGALAGTGSLMATQYPFLIAQRPRQCLPENYNTYDGYPSYITDYLSNCSGFTQVEKIHLEIPGATEEEMKEIEEILKDGIII